MPAVHAGNQVRSWFRNPQNQTDRSEIKIDLSGALTICQKHVPACGKFKTRSKIIRNWQ